MYICVCIQCEAGALSEAVEVREDQGVAVVALEEVAAGRVGAEVGRVHFLTGVAKCVPPTEQ